MTIPAILSQHAEEAAFLWGSRTRAGSDPIYSLKTLGKVDERLEAHLDGLRIAGDDGWAMCRAKLENGDAGEVFPLAILAFESGDRLRMLDALTAGCVSVDTRRALISALGWLDYHAVQPWIDRLLNAKHALHRAVGVAACAIHRQDPGAELTTAVGDPDPVLRARALRAAGELKRADVLTQARASLSDDDEACRFWAAWTLTLNGDRAGLRSLTQWLGHGDRFGAAALQLSLRAMPLDDGREWVRVLAKDPELRRSAVVAAGVLADPTTVQWIIGHMQSPPLARLAGEAFSMITGVDLVQMGFDRTGPDETDDDQASGDQTDTSIAPDYDGHLPWPDAQLIDEWWRAHHKRFSPGVRQLAGQPLTTDAARQVLRTGKQRQRAAAAIEIALREPAEMPFEIRARASEQRRRLNVRD
jgi:uncharacterized protein (TIGR02270 family)